MPDFGQWGALAVDTTPLDLVTPRINRAKAGLLESQLALAPLQREEAETTLASSKLALDQSKLASAAQKAAYQDQLVADLWKRSYNNETLNSNIDQAKKALGDDGTYSGYLDQFKDRFSPSTRRAMLALHGQGGALGAKTGAAGGGAAQSASGDGSPQSGSAPAGLDALYEGRTPQQLSEELKHYDALKQVLPTIHDQASLNAAIDKLKVAMPEAERFRGAWTDDFAGNALLDQLYGAINQHEPYLRQRLVESAAGGPSPITAKTENVGGMLVTHGPRGEVISVAGKLGAGDSFQVSSRAPEGGQKTEGAHVEGASVTPRPVGETYDQLAKFAKDAGGDDRLANYVARGAQIESAGRMFGKDGKPLKNGSSTGVLQFHEKTFRDLGGTDITSPQQQVKAMVTEAQKDTRALQGVGVDPTDANLYIMHQQGPGGGKALLTAPPDVNAIAVLTPIYGGNARMARQAIVNNGGSADMTAGQFADMWRKRWSGNKQPIGEASVPDPATPGGFKTQTLLANDEGEFDDDTAKYLAEAFVAGGKATLPPMGNGKIGAINRKKVFDVAAQIEKDTGASGQDAVARWSTMKSAQKTLESMTKQKGAIQAYEETARSNADAALKIATDAKFSENGWPLFLGAWRKGEKLTGNTPVARFWLQMDTLAGEYAKVMSGGTQSAAAGTDSARHEAQEMISKASNVQQLRGVVEQMKIDMKNRLDGLNGQIGHSEDVISTRGAFGDNPPPRDAVGYLKRNPGLAAAFDQKYGTGAARKVLGAGAL